MINRAQKSTIPSLKKSLISMKKSLKESVPGFDKRVMIPITFSRIGTHYRVENAPVPPSEKIGIMLEKSLNSFLKKLKVNYNGSKLEGVIQLETGSDSFLIEYSNIKKTNDVDVTKNSNLIRGSLN